MSDLVPEQVRAFLLNRYASQINGMGLDLQTIPDGFDFFLEGVIDSLGVLELVGALENEFQIELDMAGLEAEKMTVLGPLVDYVIRNAKQNPAGRAAPSQPL